MGKLTQSELVDKYVQLTEKYVESTNAFHELTESYLQLIKCKQAADRKVSHVRKAYDLTAAAMTVMSRAYNEDRRDLTAEEMEAISQSAVYIAEMEGFEAVLAGGEPDEPSDPLQGTASRDPSEN